jgi:hypothetical protein
MALSFQIGKAERIEPRISRLVLTGFAGRSTKEVEAHIEEMARQGVPPPAFFPMFWPVLPHLLTQDESIVVYGPDTTPEVEYVLFGWQGIAYVTLGNDQCDVEVEAKLSSEKSKNLCQKIVTREAWRVADVLPHWDEIQLTMTCNGTLMQQDRLSALIRPETLRDKVAVVDDNHDDGRMIFSGTIAMHAPLPAPPYEVSMRLTDERLGREIRYDFRITALMPY